jgi:four helix bundle protein
LISKLGIVTQELDETIYWLELLVEGEVVPAGLLTELQAEAEELLKIFVTSSRTTKQR